MTQPSWIIALTLLMVLDDPTKLDHGFDIVDGVGLIWRMFPFTLPMTTQLVFRKHLKST
jgi:hypothetical protein